VAAGGRAATQRPRTTPAAAVLWDLDGTLVDSAALWRRAYVGLARDLGGTLPAGFWAAITGTAIEESVAVLLRSLGLDGRRTCVQAAAAELVAHAERVLDGGGTPPWRPGARELLAAVQATSVPTALVTTTWGTVARRIATARGISFGAVVCGDDVARGKPAPDSYLEAARRLGVPARECVAVEDSPTGVLSAEAAGMAVLVVPSGVPIEAASRRRVAGTLAGLDDRVFAELASLPVQP
jgi:HAD superfamily hydrolase (TIGR01509 family)